MRYVETTTGNPHNVVCPSCDAAICARCAVFEVKLAPDGFDGCADCQRTMKRLQRAHREHVAKDHRA